MKRRREEQDRKGGHVKKVDPSSVQRQGRLVYIGELPKCRRFYCRERYDYVFEKEQKEAEAEEEGKGRGGEGRGGGCLDDGGVGV
ncbi:hypothetical protein M0804_002890 [Polistes exclamans]|nr:hypothetical protein M0804_002890 [Polistes exclamans]